MTGLRILIFLAKALHGVVEQFLHCDGLHGQPFDGGDGAELADDVDHAVHRAVNQRHAAAHHFRVVGGGFQEVEVADGDAEQVVQIVRDALGDGADGGGAARFAEASLQFEVFAVDFLQAQLRFDAGQGFVEVDGLGDVVHRADIEALELAFLGGARGDEDDGDGVGVGIFLEAFAGFDAVHFRHHHVEEDEVGRDAADGLEAFPAVGGGDRHPCSRAAISAPAS